MAGDMTEIVLNAMPRWATAYVYRSLSEAACGGVDPFWNDRVYTLLVTL